MQHLFYQVNAVKVADAYQNDWQVARDGKAPKPGLTQTVAGNDAGRGATQGGSVNDGRGQTAIDLGIGFGCVEAPQHLLALRPGQFKGTFDEVPVTILFNQSQCRLAGVRITRNDVHGRRFVG